MNAKLKLEDKIMSDYMIKHQDNNHNNIASRYGYRKDFNDMVNSFFNNWLDFPYENNAVKAIEPKLEITEDENEVKVAAELPGMSENDVDLEISADGYLTISGEKKQEHKEHAKGSYFSEFSYGSFKRTVALPWDMRFDDAKAEFNNGVLTVIIPKSLDEKDKKRKIEITKK